MTDNKVCTGTSISADSISVDGSPSDVTTTDDSYYGILYNILHGTTGITYPSSTDETTLFGVYSPDQDLISGALNLYLKYECEKGLKTPNYMKYILASNDSVTKGTFFANIKGLLSSTNFFASFDSIDEGQTPTNVTYGDLTDTSNNYVQNIYNVRNYTDKDEAFEVLNAIMYSLNKLIDATIKYDWRSTQSTDTSDGSDDGSDGSDGDDGTDDGSDDGTTEMTSTSDTSDTSGASDGTDNAEYIIESGTVLRFTKNATFETLKTKISKLLPNDYTSITRIDYTDIDTVMSSNTGTSNTTSNTETFSLEELYKDCASLVSIEFGDNFDASMATSMYYMFAGCSSLVSLNLNKVKTSNSLTSLQGMFYNCRSLKSISFGSNFVTSGVTNMSYMFYYCTSLEILDLGMFSTYYVTDMSYAFYYCISLRVIDIKNFDPSSSLTGSFKKTFNQVGVNNTTDHKWTLVANGKFLNKLRDINNVFSGLRSEGYTDSTVYTLIINGSTVIETAETQKCTQPLATPSYTIDDEDAINYLISTFFDTQSSKCPPYSEYMYTLTLPAILHHVTSTENHVDEFFYYMGWIGSGSKCTVLDVDGRDIIVSKSAGNTSDYSSSDYVNYGNANLGNTSASSIATDKYLEISYDPQNGSDTLKDLSATEVDNYYKYTTTKNVYTFPEDSGVLRALTKRYAGVIFHEIEKVIKNMNYYPVMLNRIHEVCFASDGFGDDAVEYYEPIIGFPTFYSTISDTISYTEGCSSPLTSNADEMVLDTSLKTNNVIRNIEVSGNNTSGLVQRYASEMVSCKGSYIYIILPTMLLDNKAETLQSYDNVVIGSDSSLSYTSSCIKLTPISTSTKDETNRKTVHLKYSINEETNMITFEYDSHNAMQHVAVSTGSNMTAYVKDSGTVYVNDSETTTNPPQLKALNCSYSTSWTTSPYFLLNSHLKRE